jgi:DNA invertase Pin-like site-specific DNA recombinase
MKDVTENPPLIKKVALYARVSRDDLFCENQTRVLRDWAIRNDVPEDGYVLFTETETTRKTRPVKENMIGRFRAGEFDVVVVVRLDRFARSSQEILMNVSEIIEKGGRFVAIAQGFDFSKKLSAAQSLIFKIFSDFAEFERDLNSERTKDGLARARAQGKKLGRPRKIKENAPPKEAPQVVTLG